MRWINRREREREESEKQKEKRGSFHSILPSLFIPLY